MLLFLNNAELAAVIVIPALLPDSRSKVDVNKVVYVAKVICTFLSAIIICLVHCVLLCVVTPK